MTYLSQKQLGDFFMTHPHEDIADIGGLGLLGMDEVIDFDLVKTGFDICKTPLPRKYKTVLCMDTFEHLLDPVRAAENIVKSLDGWLFVTTAFSWDKHEHPIDTYRYSDTVLSWLFRDLKEERCWFEEDGGVPTMKTRIRVSYIGRSK